MLPRISGILPCGQGAKYVGVAIQCWLDQTYEGEMELVIVDNNTEPFEFGCQIPEEKMGRFTTKYVKTAIKKVGALRNLGTSLATGEICYTIDEDDWSHPDRVKEQYKRLVETGKAVTGFHNILYYDTKDARTYKYFYEIEPQRNHPPYAMGTSQCYLKAWWEQHPFPEDQPVEDYGFQQQAQGWTCFKGNAAAGYGTLGALGSNANWESHFILKLGVSTANVALRFGFVKSGQAAGDAPTDGIYVEYDTANTGNTDSKFTWVTRSASTPNYSTTNAIAADTSFHHFKIRSTSAGTILFSVDGGTETSINTDVTSAVLTPWFQILTRTTAAKDFYIDYCSYIATNSRT